HDRYGVALNFGNDVIGDYGDKFLTATGFGLLSIPDRSGFLDRSLGAPGVFYGVAGLRFYTPLEKETDTPPPGDRPYAAYGFLGFGAAVARTSGDGVDQDRLQVEIGLTGPELYADEIQNGLHDVIGSEDVNGWDTQVATEGYVTLEAERAWRRFVPFDYRELEVAPFVGGALGTAETSATVGVDFAWGPDLGRDLFWRDRATGVRSELAAAPTLEPTWRLVGGADVKFVAHDATLDGGFFNDGRDVDKTTARWRVRAGAEARWRVWRLAYDLSLMGPEFVGQGQPQAVGSLTLGATF
ncbi:MAG: lipid A deacylase LpxR family protein, partial [Pseudomonadota bacterium]